MDFARWEALIVEYVEIHTVSGVIYWLRKERCRPFGRHQL